jgi:hypothetical protein
MNWRKVAVLGAIYGGCLTGPAQAAEKTIEGWMLERMIQEQELNPCRIERPVDEVVVNPVAFYVEIEDGQKEKGIVNQISLDIRLAANPNEPLAGAFQTFPASELTPVPGYANCYRKQWTPPSMLVKDNTTKYIGRLRGENTAGPIGPWKDMDRPFKLAAIGTEPIRAISGRFTGVQ